MRPIDADKLVYQIDRKIPSYTGGNDNFVRGFKDALLRFKSMVHSAKTIDIPEIVRCKDCCMLNEDGTCSIHCDNYGNNIDPYPDYFCASGVKKC